MRCVSCDLENPKEMKFCTGCGASLAQRCPSCASENCPTARFCGQCGTALGSGAAPESIQPAQPSAGIGTPTGGAAAARTPQEAERRQLTIMFCDLVESTSLSEQLDPEELRRVLRDYQMMCSTIIRRYDGTVAQYLGDGLLVYFGYPRAHEDDARRAVHAGVGIVEAIDGLNAKLEEELGLRLSLRLAIHTGLVVVGELGDDGKREHLALGETPNVAARVQALAETGTVTITGTTFRLIEGLFECKDLGPHVLKGISQPLRLYQVLHDSTARSRLDVSDGTSFTPLVGRKQEMGLLVDRWEEVTDGVGQVVVLSGEAGVGKSRLVRMLKEHVSGNPQAWLTSFECSPYHQNSAFYPIIDTLERVVLQFSRNDTMRDRQAKLEGFLVQYGLSLPETLPLFAALLSVPLPESYSPLALTPERQKQETLTVLLTMLLKRAAKQPLLLLVEDLHWIDPSTLELLSLIVDQGPTTAILAVFTCRPDFESPWTGRSHLTQVTLNRLTRRQVVDMVARVAGGKILPAELIEQIALKTDGVPLFVEELTKMVLESGLLEDHKDHYELSKPLPALAIPTTLQDSLMARLDRLATVKEVAQLAATLGRDFTFELLKAVSPLEEKILAKELSQLVEAGLLYQRGVPPQATFIFKHALIQDAAYQSLLKSKRQQYHARIAKVLVERFPAMVERLPEVIAHHFTEGGLASEAIGYWVKAGRLGLARSANREAVTSFEQALHLLKTLPETQSTLEQGCDLRLELRPALSLLGEARRTLEFLREAEALAERLNDDLRRGRVSAFLSNIHLQLGELDEALAAASRALETAGGLGDLRLRILATSYLLYAHYLRGEYDRVIELATGNLAALPADWAYENFGLSAPPSVWDRTWLVMSLAELGRFGEAAKYEVEAMRLAEPTQHVFTVAFAHWSVAALHLIKGDGMKPRSLIEHWIALLRAGNVVLLLPYAVASSAWVLAQLGEASEALNRLSEGEQLLERQAARGIVGLRAWGYHALARASLRLDRLDEARRLGDRAVESSSSEPGFAAHALHLLGDIATHPDRFDAEGGEAHYLQALALAEPRGMRPLVAHCHFGLGKLYRRTGMCEKAREHVATATMMYRDMGMTYWLEQAEAEMRRLQ